MGKTYAEYTIYETYVVEVKGKFLWIETDSHPRRGLTAKLSHKSVAFSVEELRRPREIPFSKTPNGVLREVFSHLHPKGTEDDFRVFLYREKIGAQINADYAWATENIIGDLEATYELLQQIGRWEKPTFEKNEKIPMGRVAYYLTKVGDKQYRLTLKSVLDIGKGCWMSLTAEEVNPDAEKDEKKAYARKCGILSRKYSVPFSNALKFGHDEERYKLYEKEISQAREKIKKLSDKEVECYLHELSCGRARVEAAIKFFGITIYGDPKYFDCSDLFSALEARKS